jgi:hypothetical protein
MNDMFDIAEVRKSSMSPGKRKDLYCNDLQADNEDEPFNFLLSQTKGGGSATFLCAEMDMATHSGVRAV